MLKGILSGFGLVVSISISSARFLWRNLPLAILGNRKTSIGMCRWFLLLRIDWVINLSCCSSLERPFLSVPILIFDPLIEVHLTDFWRWRGSKTIYACWCRSHVWDKRCRKCDYGDSDNKNSGISWVLIVMVALCHFIMRKEAPKQNMSVKWIMVLAGNVLMPFLMSKLTWLLRKASVSTSQQQLRSWKPFIIPVPLHLNTQGTCH